MAFKLYITPAIIIFPGDLDREMRVPKYWRTETTLLAGYSAADYGFQPLFMVVSDLTPEQETTVLAHSDTFAFPVNLDLTLSGGQANQLKNALESALVPAHTISTGDTWRTVARMVYGLFQFMQRLNAELGNTVVIDSSQKLNVQWQTIPENIQQAILDTAVSFGIDTSPLQPTTTIRAILKYLADAWAGKPYQLGPLSF